MGLTRLEKKNRPIIQPISHKDDNLHETKGLIWPAAGCKEQADVFQDRVAL